MQLHCLVNKTTISSRIRSPMKKSLILTTITALCLISCGQSVCKGDFTEKEKALIMKALSADGTEYPAGTMRVLTIADSADNAVLRSVSENFSAKALRSDEYADLCSLMVATVTHPSQDGVGIAGPQVGLNRRVVAVQRFDKEGEPFEIYPNISIIWSSDSLEAGPEGCLSVPDRRADVLRSKEIIIEYADVTKYSTTEDCDEIKMVRDTINGFTAVIFQHETDHLDGILYIDRL